MTISRVHGLSDRSTGLPLSLLLVGSIGLVEVFGHSELVGTSGSSESTSDGGDESSSIWSILLISANGEPAEEDDDIPFSSIARMHASMSRLEYFPRSNHVFSSQVSVMFA